MLGIICWSVFLWRATIWGVENCKTFDTKWFISICSECQDGFYLDENKLYCGKCGDGCKTCSFNNKNSGSTKCIECKDGFYLNPDFKCEKCTIGNCKICDGLVCNKCFDSYFKKDAACEYCMFGCKLCSNETECEECINPFEKKEKYGKQICEFNKPKDKVPLNFKEIFWGCFVVVLALVLMIAHFIYDEWAGKIKASCNCGNSGSQVD